MPKFKGIPVDLYRDHPACDYSQVTDRRNRFILIGHGIPPVFETEDPEQVLKVVVRDIYGKEYIHAEPIQPVSPGRKGYMMGGNFVYSCDSRFRQLVNAYPIAVHDRTEY